MERQMRRAADEQVTCEFQGNDAAAERSYENRAFPTPDGGVAVCFRDITERRQHERLIESARAYAEGIVTTVREPLLVLDKGLRVVSANRSFYATFEVEPSETEGRFVYDLGDGQWDIPELRTLLEEIVPANNWFDDFEVEHEFEQIGRKTMLLNARRFPPEGLFELLLLAIEDITERKQAEETGALLAAIVEDSDDAIVSKTVEGIIRSWNGGAERLFGYTAAEAVGRSIDLIIPPELQEEERSILERLRRGERVEHFETVRVSKESRRILISLTISPLRDKAGRVVGASKVARDITERRRAEEALRESEERLRLAADLVGLSTYEWDLRTRWEPVWDARLKQMWGLPPDAIVDRETVRAGIHPDDLPKVDAAVAQALDPAGDGGYAAEYRVIGIGDGVERWVSARGRAIFADGRPVRLVGAVMEITDRKRAEEAIRRAKEAAEAANRSKDEFLANVSHEIRTPFGAILGMTELVLETPLTEDQRQCLDMVKSAADNLLGLVDDLLHFEKIGAGKLELAPADFLLRPMMADALRALGVRAHAKGLELTCNIEPDVPDALVGDAVRLRQVLQNLVGNAIKFTKQGEVAVRVEVADGPATGEEFVLRFTVRDTGIGIPTDGRERIFRAFEQADSSTTREYGGTGLGLTIASRLVALMGGEIGVESEPGKGSTFTFTARFGQERHPSEAGGVARPSDSTHEAATSAPAVAPLRILVAEDSEFNSRHIARLLGRRGHAVRVATDGRQALDLVGEAAFDLLLLDIHMPELDGFQVAQAIRARERASGGHLPVIALTAGARPEDRERCLAAGMDDYLSKPVRAAELFAMIERLVSAYGGPGPGN
jgi:PAS domain S-box-containing protein